MAVALVGSLVLSSLDGRPLRAAGPAGATEGAVSVNSDPVGAAVYVDGEFVGRTPLKVQQLTAGSHRVRVVKDGYLENGRMVTVAAGRTDSLEVRLTARAGSAFPAAAQGQPMAFRIVVLEGDDAVNIIDKMTATQPVVEVVDRNNLPVAGASVIFLIRGNSASFANGARQVALTTDSAGRATVTGLNPVGKGNFDIQVRASFMGQNATATIHQTNLPTSPTSGGGQGQGAGQSGAAAGGGVAAAGGLSGLAIGGIVAGAAAGTLVAVKAAGGSSDNAAPCDATCTISSSSLNISSAGGTLSVNVTAPASIASVSAPAANGKAWTATSNAAFITVSPASGTGNATVTLTVQANTGALRTGTVTVAGRTVTVTQSAAELCNSTTIAGGDTPETHVVQMGRASGSFVFTFDTQNIADRLVVTYQNSTLFDSGCVSTGFPQQRTLQYSGTTTTVTVTATPNCAGGTSGTFWQFSVSCPQ
jgi:hypothetical protein